MKELLEKMRKKILPGTTTFQKVEAVVNQINKGLQNEELKAECMIGGSFAKNTHLKGDHDVDLFVRFDYETYKNEDISEALDYALPYPTTLISGSRDYFQFSRSGLDFEVVPVLKVDDYKDARNVTDMSPLHVDFVKKHFKKHPGLNDEIRLAKQFCKSIRVYGAESYIQGFSGHVIDLLVIYYGGFEKMVRAASTWGKRVVIDIESHWSNPLKQLNKSKLESPLVMVDPVQPDRNASAALSEDKFELFKARCKEFLEDPDESFFKVSTFKVRDLEEKAAESDSYELVIMRMWPFKGKEDVMGAKLRQAHEYLFSKIQEQKWPIIESDWQFIKGKKTRSKKKNWDSEPHSFVYFIIDANVPSFIERQGPPLSQPDDVKKFHKLHKNTYVKGGRIYTRIRRKHDNPVDLIDDILDHRYIVERIKQAEFEE